VNNHGPDPKAERLANGEHWIRRRSEKRFCFSHVPSVLAGRRSFAGFAQGCASHP
jgi:hypothetical protein